MEGTELRYSFSSDASQPITALVATAKGFLAGTGSGAVLVFEKDDKEGYRRVKAVAVESAARIVAMAVSPSEDMLAVSLDNNQLLTMPLNAVELLKVRRGRLVAALLLLCFCGYFVSSALILFFGFFVAILLAMYCWRCCATL